uniref:Mitochondrial carrier protein n=1 Tax=Chromera velia CCMP2878 TaxID=1169474 RepID=A0A0G4GQC7_9ALVE|eukprot:Cvel_22908.t1-p1 / transcript=Cvel_22908.t1 / gene=Cvel_22908 / organism=Chromera_velia_CCMP2878 / gene_product=S-adenosylmethionine mitochondrial carrier protein, putative / transcript_product=S-adenosylmethionine mitochondrial carrier protein, putative / location=Cvel_scaffold2302:8825-11051(+) / protein_length=391 / sequence_SO=supercontig / SO=protein_coding / is_pseudo=false
MASQRYLLFAALLAALFARISSESSPAKAAVRTVSGGTLSLPSVRLGRRRPVSSDGVSELVLDSLEGKRRQGNAKRTKGNEDSIQFLSAGGGGGSGDAKGNAVSVSSSSPARTFVIGLLSGAMCGMATDFFFFPLDTIKTRIQMGGKVDLTGRLMNGLLPALLAGAPSTAAMFGVLDYVKSQVPGRFSAFSGAFAGNLAQTLVRNPFELLKQRVQGGLDPNSFAALGSVLRRDGPLGLWRGVSALLARDLPFDLIEYPLYDYLKGRALAVKKAASRSRGMETSEVDALTLAGWETAVCGLTAGALTGLVTCPLDVVKTRMMTAAAGTAAANSFLSCLQYVVKTEGAMALFAGAKQRALSIALGGAVFFGAYEVAKKKLEEVIPQDFGKGKA